MRSKKPKLPEGLLIIQKFLAQATASFGKPKLREDCEPGADDPTIGIVGSRYEIMYCTSDNKVFINKITTIPGRNYMRNGDPGYPAEMDVDTVEDCEWEWTGPQCNLDLVIVEKYIELWNAEKLADVLELEGENRMFEIIRRGEETNGE